MNDTHYDRMGLLMLAALIVLGLILISRWALVHEMKSDAAVVIGGVATGLIAFGKDIVAAIRGYSMSAQLSKVTDQLAASAPSNDNQPVPQDAAAGARDVADAADAKATTLEARA